jgi:integral membrane protein (TIGR00529 family)
VELVKLFIVFAVILLVMMVFKKPLWLGTILAIVTSIIVFSISLPDAGKLIIGALIDQSTIEIVGVVYLVNFLQIMMQGKGMINKAEKAMMRFFNNRRTIILFAPVFMGLLPAPHAVVLSAPIVDSTAVDRLNKGDKTFLTSYLRHIPESALPLYPSLLLALKVTRLSAGYFLLGVIPLTTISILYCYFAKVRKVPKDTGLPPSDNRKKDFIEMISALWPILVLISFVVFGGFNTAITTLAACLLLYFFYRYPIGRLWSFLSKSFNISTILAMALVMVLKDIVASTGIIAKLPSQFAALPIPIFLMYGLITFIGSLTGLGNVVIAVLFPVAFATIPGSGIPLLLLLMAFSHSAAQISPTHICLEIAVNYFNIDFQTLILKTLPVTVLYCISAVLYYLLLTTKF